MADKTPSFSDLIIKNKENIYANLASENTAKKLIEIIGKSNLYIDGTGWKNSVKTNGIKTQIFHVRNFIEHFLNNFYKEISRSKINDIEKEIENIKRIKETFVNVINDINKLGILNIFYEDIKNKKDIFKESNANIPIKKILKNLNTNQFSKDETIISESYIRYIYDSLSMLESEVIKTRDEFSKSGSKQRVLPKKMNLYDLYDGNNAYIAFLTYAIWLYIGLTNPDISKLQGKNVSRKYSLEDEKLEKFICYLYNILCGIIETEFKSNNAILKLVYEILNEFDYEELMRAGISIQDIPTLKKPVKKTTP